MSFNLRNRSFLKLLDFTPTEIKFLLKLSADLKAAKYGGYEVQRLKGKNIALIFEKSSTRTRTSFEVAAYDQGANVTYLGPSGSHIGHKETMKDTARVLGRTYDGIEYRGFAQATVETLAQYAGVPVWNGLTDEFHPTQILADVLTMIEHSYKDLPEIARELTPEDTALHARCDAIAAKCRDVNELLVELGPVRPDRDSGMSVRLQDLPDVEVEAVAHDEEGKRIH